MIVRRDSMKKPDIKKRNEKPAIKEVAELVAQAGKAGSLSLQANVMAVFKTNIDIEPQTFVLFYQNKAGKFFISTCVLGDGDMKKVFTRISRAKGPKLKAAWCVRQLVNAGTLLYVVFDNNEYYVCTAEDLQPHPAQPHDKRRQA